MQGLTQIQPSIVFASSMRSDGTINTSGVSEIIICLYCAHSTGVEGLPGYTGKNVFCCKMDYQASSTLGVVTSFTTVERINSLITSALMVPKVMSFILNDCGLAIRIKLDSE